MQPNETYQSELVSLIEIVISKVSDDSDMLWTRYGSPHELRKELTAIVEQLVSNDYSSLESLNIHFAPTSTFQEHSISNGWETEYITLSTKFDSLYNKLKK